MVFLKARSVFILASSLILSGCAGILSPEPPPVFVAKNQDNRLSLDELSRLKAKYNDSLWVLKSVPMADAARNEMLWGLISDIDYSYYYFQSRFASGRATVKTVGDMAQLGMSTAATALGGSAVLSAATAALAGSQLSADKNFFNEAATASIFVQMDALRARQLARIQQKLVMNSTRYSFEEAYHDAIAYFAAGTIIAAQSAIAESVGVQKTEADQEVSAAIKARIVGTLPAVTAVEVRQGSNLREAIRRAVNNGEMKKMVAVLEARNIAPKATLVEVSGQLEDVLADGSLTPEQLKVLAQQFTAAGLIPYKL